MLDFERVYPFAPAIVWDALIDPDLLAGWLGEAVVTPEVGGEYSLRWLHRPGQPRVTGTITAADPPTRLRVEAATATWEFRLVEVPGGNRGTSTRLELEVTFPAGETSGPVPTADWLTRLDQLRELLHGHPVDWTAWDRDWLDDWSGHLATARDSTA